MKVKKNDTVLVVTGKDAGKTAKVLVALPKANKIVVDGVNVQKKHKKARNTNEVSSIVEQAGAIDASNVLVVCPVCGKATRVAYKLEGDKKIRVCKKCGASLDEAKATKSAPTKTAKATKVAKVEAEKVEATEETKPAPKKKTTTKKAAEKPAKAE